MNYQNNYQNLLEHIYNDIAPYIGEGVAASYIPELARVPTNKFGMALHTIDGEIYTVGDAEEAFSIQSISKLFTLTLALKQHGQSLWQRVGREPSGNAFNSLVQLEYEQGIPRNPFINAGALVITDLLCSSYNDAKSRVLDFISLLSDNEELTFNKAVAASELEHGHRNRAMGNFLKSFDNIRNNVDEVIQAYFHHCSITMNCVELAQACHYLINSGRLINSSTNILSQRETKYINALMMTCGTYDAAGEFAYRVGLPCKSGVGGGIVAVMPGQFSVCVWSPGLDANGNSLVGLKALDSLTTKTGVSIF